jgi:hypothetical protein
MPTIRTSTLALTLATALVCLPAMAQDTPETRRAAMERYMQAVPMAVMMEDAYSELAKQVPAEKRAEFIRAMRKSVRLDRIEQLARASMLKTFTTDELNALADFYSSKNGASAMRKYGVYMGDLMPSLMQEVQRAVQELQSQKK